MGRGWKRAGSTQAPRQSITRQENKRGEVAAENERRSPSRVACAGCGHSEFIHCDRDARSCLYSECRCRSFSEPDAGDVGAHARKGPRARSAAAFAHR